MRIRKPGKPTTPMQVAPRPMPQDGPKPGINIPDGMHGKGGNLGGDTSGAHGDGENKGSRVKRVDDTRKPDIAAG